jgi:hypothetical protein
VFSAELASAVRADGGKCKQFPALTDHKESLVAKPVVESIGGKIGDWSGIH